MEKNIGKTPSSPMSNQVSTEIMIQYIKQQQDVAEWLEKVHGDEEVEWYSENRDLIENIKDGNILVRIMARLFPAGECYKKYGMKSKSTTERWDVVKDVARSQSTAHFRARDRLSQFLQDCQTIGVSSVDLFDAEDLTDFKSPLKVLDCLYALGRSVSGPPCNYEGPVLKVGHGRTIIVSKKMIEKAKESLLKINDQNALEKLAQKQKKEKTEFEIVEKVASRIKSQFIEKQEANVHKEKLEIEAVSNLKQRGRAASIKREKETEKQKANTEHSTLNPDYEANGPFKGEAPSKIKPNEEENIQEGSGVLHVPDLTVPEISEHDTPHARESVDPDVPEVMAKSDEQIVPDESGDEDGNNFEVTHQEQPEKSTGGMKSNEGISKTDDISLDQLKSTPKIEVIPAQHSQPSHVDDEDSVSEIDLNEERVVLNVKGGYVQSLKGALADPEDMWRYFSWFALALTFLVLLRVYKIIKSEDDMWYGPNPT